MVFENLKRVVLVGLFSLVVASFLRAQSPAKLGINLSGPADWNTELPFVDVFHFSRPWIGQQKGKPWGEGPPLELDSLGWPRSLQSNCWAETLLCTIEGGHYPSGVYHVFYEGEGQVEVGGAAQLLQQDDGHLKIQVDSSKGAIFLRIKKTNPDNYVRHIQVILPGFEDTYQKNPFRPGFIQSWQGVACLRFMDWMHTNGSVVQKWEERPRLQTASYSSKGVPLELMIDLCNRLHADAWFCMPHRADKEYLRQFAKQVLAQLDPELKVYVEYSNEVWNRQFPQAAYSWERGAELGLGSKDRPWEGGGMYYAKRAKEVFSIWEDVFPQERLVRVLAWQAGSTWWMENIVLPQDEVFKNADALAIAPYFSMRLGRGAKGLSTKEVATWSLAQLFEHLSQVSLPKAKENMELSAQVAKKYGLQLLAYEGGQHLVGVGEDANNLALTKLFHAANRDNRMEALYQNYLQQWLDVDGGLFCHFSSVAKWTKWGSWGVVQYFDDKAAESPKMRALQAWAKVCGQKLGVGP